ncbi:sedoheptulokinase [Paenibacillus humicola]|uniref:sedoheptulokinase n=1 Tax=Paenibacillus humicola TaxID=3110540 RepID=UPI00237B5D83|nr:FGGY family carbohydrate kinase [Paenibacillus humicola]
MLVAGIDIGTTSVSAALVSAETGETVRVAGRANDAALESGRSWERLQDPERIAAIVRELIGECRALWPEVAAVGISCQMHGILYVDREGGAVSPLYTWQDGRADVPMEPGGETYALRLGRIGGRALAAGYGLATHYYNANNGEVPDDAAYLCTIGDYIAMKLTGAAVPQIEPSNAASLGLFSPEADAFDAAALRRAGLDPAILPPVCRGIGIAGRTPDGKPLACAIGDNQASFLGAVSRLEGTLLANVGTGSQISVYSGQAEEIAGLETRPFPGGGFLIVGAPLGGGKSYALLERFFKETCRAFGAGTGAGDIYERMNALAAEALETGLGPLRIGTQFYGTRRNPLALGQIAGLNDDNFRPGHFAAGVLAGIADELMDFVHLLPGRLRGQIIAAAGSGNGIRKNPVLQRLLQERLNLPLTLAATQEEAAYGAAVYAAAAAGLFPDVKTALAGMRKG